MEKAGLGREPSEQAADLTGRARGKQRARGPRPRCGHPGEGLARSNPAAPRAPRRPHRTVPVPEPSDGPGAAPREHDLTPNPRWMLKVLTGTHSQSRHGKQGFWKGGLRGEPRGCHDMLPMFHKENQSTGLTQIFQSYTASQELRNLSSIPWG